jgi:hypothetical protein
LNKTKDEFENNQWKTPGHIPRSHLYQDDENRFQSHDGIVLDKVIGDGAFFSNRLPSMNADITGMGSPIGKINIVD